MVRSVERKIIAEVCRSGDSYLVDLRTRNTPIGLFCIPDGKDPAEWMRRMGWTYIGRTDDLRGEAWGKIASL